MPKIDLAAVPARKGSGYTGYEELHAVDYLVYAYLQEGRYAEAKALLDKLNQRRRSNSDGAQ